MVPDKYVELIHADIDGRLPDNQRAELARCLLENPEARRLHEDLRRLSTALARVESVPPPRGLRETVLQAVDHLPTVAARRAAGRPWRFPVMLRYAAAFAGGVIVSTVAFEVGADRSAHFDVADLVGTIVSQAPQKQARDPADDSVTLQHGRGTASVRQTPSGLVVEYDLAAGQPVRIVTTVASPDVPAVDLELYAGGTLVQRESLGVTRSD